MAYNWAQLAFVEKWRLHAVRGPLIGMYRPEDRTYFDLRLRPSEGGVGQIPGPVEIHLLDSGDIIREKRIAFTSTVAVVIRIVASQVTPVPGKAPAPTGGRARRWLEPNSRVAGTMLQQEGDTALVDVGLPVVVQLPEEGGTPGLTPGQGVELTIAETPKGFLVI